MSWIPGWDSVASAGWWSGFFFWASIVALICLGIAEVASHRYSDRKDELVAIEQEAIQRRHDEDMARVQHETAQANERAAKLEHEAATLRLELNREVQKHAQRLLDDDQKAAMLSELKGKLPEIAVVIQNDPEAHAFAIQFFDVFQDAGAKIYAPEPPREDKWFAPAGLLMYSPLGNSIDELKDDPLYRALTRANLFGGITGGPFTSGQPRVPTLALIQGYNGRVLYIGQKSPF